jgi:hypothetical protein
MSRWPVSALKVADLSSGRIRTAIMPDPSGRAKVAAHRSFAEF